MARYVILKQIDDFNTKSVKVLYNLDDAKEYAQNLIASSEQKDRYIIARLVGSIEHTGRYRPYTK